MSDIDWIDAETACTLLGVRRQTLYAYVSRKMLRACGDDADSRRSLYARPDVETLAARNKRPRQRSKVARAAIDWGDPVLTTSVSGIRDGDLWFGSVRAVQLARHMTLEQITAHHCRVPSLSLPFVPAPLRHGTTPLARSLTTLSSAAARAAPMQGRTREALARDGAELLARVAAATLGASITDGQPIHCLLAEHWDVSPSAAEHLRAALVLLSDHELNPSTFAVRICASTGASLAACLLAGLSTLSGPRHGGVAVKARQALLASMDGKASAFLSEHAGLAPYAFGYGHPLYPNGDPRAEHLLDLLGSGHTAVMAAQNFGELLGLHPNIDTALAALAHSFNLPADAAFTLFALGRLAGWIAHAIEQVEAGQIIRPRAEFAPL